MTLSLTAENIARFERMTAGEIICELEALDGAFYAAVPPPAALAEMYGDPAGDRLYRYRDLVLLWTGRYVWENDIKAHDMTCERGHFSARV